MRSLGRQRARLFLAATIALVAVLAAQTHGSRAWATPGGTAPADESGLSAAGSGGRAEPLARLQGTGIADTTGNDGPSGDDRSSDDAQLALLTALVAAICIAVLIVGFRLVSARSSTRQPEAADTWRTDISESCARGRVLIEVTTERRPDQPGSGLSVDQLRHIDDAIHKLITELRIAEAEAPAGFDLHALNEATSHAYGLATAVQNDRHLRLAATTPDVSVLRASGEQLARERTALDRSLAELSAIVAADP